MSIVQKLRDLGIIPQNDLVNSSTPGVPEWFKTAQIEIDTKVDKIRAIQESVLNVQMYKSLVYKALINGYHFSTLLTWCGHTLAQIDGMKFLSYSNDTIILYECVEMKMMLNFSRDTNPHWGIYTSKDRVKLLYHFVNHLKMTDEIKLNRRNTAATKIQRWWKEQIRYNPDHPVCQKWMMKIQSQWDKCGYRSGSEIKCVAPLETDASQTA